MPRRWLIVCGGSGVNLLGQRKVLGVDAELQVDVTEEINLSLEQRPQRRGILERFIRYFAGSCWTRVCWR